jgi:hypothetical protein
MEGSGRRSSRATTGHAREAQLAAQTTVDPMIAAALARLDAASQAIVALQPAIEAGEPWPLAERFGAEPEAHWGPREVLAHCEEMLPYWIGEIERIVDGPEPAPYGRIQEDAVRIGIIERDRSLPIRELMARIAAGTARFDRRLPELGAADLARRGLHPTRGEQTIEQLLEQTVVGHMEGHLDQLREALAERA